MRDDGLTDWQRRGRKMGLELAAVAKQAIEAGELVEVCARTLAETTVRLAGECATAGAARDEIVAYVNELWASFGETIKAMGSAATAQPIAEARAEPSSSPATLSATPPSSRSLRSSKPATRSRRRAKSG